MSIGAGRILTTHTGSLPRPDDLIQIMWAKGDGIPVDAAALSDRIATAVQQVVDRQAEAGVSVVNDGEMSKPSYATYVKDRLHGFGGESVQDYFFADLVDYPRSAEMVSANPGRRKRTAGLQRPDLGQGPRRHHPGHGQPQQGRRRHRARPSTAPSRARRRPASCRCSSPTSSMPPTRSTSSPSPRRCATSTRPSPPAGPAVQVDCPDLAMGRHSAYADMDLTQFRRRVALNIEALNHAVRDIPADRLRMHLCWGNYPGPHHRDVDLADIIDLIWTAKPRTVLFEAANPRHAHEWTLFEDTEVPDDKILCPGVIEPQSNYIEHPELVAQRIERYARLVGRDRLMAGVDCGFSVHVGTQGIDPDVTWGKLRALADGAAIASDRLWR